MPASPPLDGCFLALRTGLGAARTRTWAGLRELLSACRTSLAAHAAEWVAAAAAAKGLPADPAVIAEEWGHGPLVVARHLRCLLATTRSLAQGTLPRVAMREGAVVATPADWFDRLMLPGYRATVAVTADGGPLQQEPPSGGQGVHVVLGAGNTTGMPIGDALHAICQRGASVLLKLSPLHSQLLPALTRALQPLVDADLLRLVVGDGKLGCAAAAHADCDAWHLTGSRATLQALRHDATTSGKPFTAELGGVTPVVVLPLRSSDAELRAIARHIATAAADNAGCNCVTPRAVLLARDWPHRGAFARHLVQAFAALPARLPFHPGVRERFQRHAARPAPPHGPLPFALRVDADPDREPWLLAEESFAPVVNCFLLAGTDAVAFAHNAAAFVHERTTSALATMLFAPGPPAAAAAALQPLLAALPHGTIAINTWAAMGYALMTTPWGAGSRSQGDATGRGFVHNTLLLRAPQRTIVRAPLRPWLPPPWWHSQAAHAMLTAMFAAHIRCTPSRLLRLALAALRQGGPA